MYWDLSRYFNDYLSNTPGYNPDALFLNTKACKPGTRGTIEEDFEFLEGNWFPYLDHFWDPWDPYGAEHNAVAYANTIFNEAVMHFADGLEEEAFFDFGRCTHVLEDMGSVPHLFSDMHPSLLNINASGFEKWCYEHQEALPTSTESVAVTSLSSAMESLGVETYRSARIQGTLRRDVVDSADGDIAELFPQLIYVKLLSLDADEPLVEYWWIDGVGRYSPGDDPTGSELDEWGRVPNLPGESGEHYYIQYNQEHVVPDKVYSSADGAFVPNTARYNLAQLWGGVEGYRPTPAQEHGRIPRTIEYTAGFMKYIWDFVNPPPHLSGVRVEQDQNGDGAIDPAAGELICDRSWRETKDPDTFLNTGRILIKAPSAPATAAPVRIELRFSEMVRDVSVALGREAPTLTIGSNLTSERGPPTPEHPDGQPRLVLDDVDLATLPVGTITLFVTAEDLSIHLPPVASSLDPDPSTRAGRLPNGSWRHYESGGDFPATDRNHSFDLGGFAIRAVPSSHLCVPGIALRHELQARNVLLPADTEATLTAVGTSPGWSSNAADLDGSTFRLPAAGGTWRPVGLTLTTSCSASAVSDLTTDISAAAAGTTSPYKVTDSINTPPGNDHPDDTQSVADPRYPTPWLLDTAAPIGILLNGWGAGIGHLLGRYGIAAAPISTDLTILNGSGADIGALEVLIVGSGGLAGLDRLPSFRDGLSRFVAGGGALIAFTPQHGAELAALPGGAVAGYGWSEDQSCFGAAARIAAPDPALAGQTTPRLDVGADGYLTRWPEDAAVLLERTSNSQPAMIRYRYGNGVVYALTLYPDWAYGAGQSSRHEWALVRDLVTAALAHPGAIPEFGAGDDATLQIPVANGSWTQTAAVSLEPRSPDRAALAPTVVPLPLEEGESSSLPLEFIAPADPGIYPVGYRLLAEDGRAVQHTAGAAYFAVPGLDPPQPPPPRSFQLWVTVPDDEVAFGSSVNATVHVRNATAEDYTGHILATWVHFYAGPVVWVTDAFIPAGGTASFAVDYPVLWGEPFTLFFGLFDLPVLVTPDRLLSESRAYASKGLTPFVPKARIELTTESPQVLPGVPLPVTVRVTNASPGPLAAECTLRLRSPDNREIWSESRACPLQPSATVELALEVLAGDFETGPAVLEAEARQSGAVVGRATRLLTHPAVRLSISPELPARWDPRAPASLSFLIRNDGRVATAPGTFAAAIDDAPDHPLWSASAALPALGVGETASIAFSAALPPLPFGDFHLRYAATLPRDRFAGARRLRNAVSVTVAAAPVTLGAGETLTGAAALFNAGDFVVAGTLAIASPGLLAEITEALEIDAGARASRDFSAPVTDETPPGTYEITATFAAAGTASATASVVVPPARLAFLPPAAEIDAGDVLTITASNDGRNAGTFECAARLLPISADPDDPLVEPLALAQRTVRLAAGAAAVLELAVPPDLADGTYGLVLSGRDAVTSGVATLRTHLFVHGLSATLVVATDRGVYARADPVTALARATNGPAALGGATLTLSVAGAGAIAPVAYSGTVFVSPAGDDVTGDGSRERPYATAQRGVGAAAPGSRVLLLAGTYTAGAILREGTILQGEVVAGEPAAVLSGADIAGASATIVDHLTLRDGSVFYPAAAADVRVTDCVFAGGARTVPPRGQGIVFAAPASGVVAGRNRFSGYRDRFAGIQFLSTAAGALVLENSLADFTGAGNSGIHFWDVASDVVAQGNVLADIGGYSAGVHFWGYAAASRNLKIVGNRLDRAPGDCNGIQLWGNTEDVEVRGNRLAHLEGACVGIHLWERAVAAVVADNRIEDCAGDASGIQLWESWRTRHLDVRIENNLIAGIAPLDDRAMDNGIVVWGGADRLAISRNRLDQVTDAAPAQLRSGIVVAASASSLTLERNIVRGSPVGFALRLPVSTPANPVAPFVDTLLANNLATDVVVGFLEENPRPGGDVGFSNGILTSASRAAALALGTPPPEGPAAVDHTLFFSNAADAEGRPDPLGRDGNLSADPLFADAAAGDFHLLPGSPCDDAGSPAGLDIGPHDDRLSPVLGPRPVAPAAVSVVHWQQSLPLDLDEAGTRDLTTPVTPLAAAGDLLLQGRITSARGQVLAEDTAAFTIQADPVLLSLSTAREAFRPGETIPVQLVVLNTGEAPAEGLLVRVAQAGEEVYASTVTLPAGGQAALAFETSAEADTVLHATAGLAAADLAIAVASPEIRLTLEAPAIVGFEPFPLEALVENTGRVPAALSLDLAGSADDFTLEPGESRAFRRTASIVEDTTFVATIVREASAAASRRVAFGPRVSLALDAPPIQQAGAAAATLLLANDGSYAAALTVDLGLATGSGTPVATWRRDVWLPPEGELRETLDLGELAPGEYILRAAGGPLSAETSFRVAAARSARILSVVVGGALDAEGRLPVAVTVLNAGAAALPVTVSLSTDFSPDAAADFELAPGEERLVPFALAVDGVPPGDYVAVAGLAAGWGIDDTATAPVTLGADLAIAAVPEGAELVPGSPADLVVSVANAGLLRAATRLRLSSGELFDATQELVVAPGGEVQTTFGVTLPADTPGNLPVVARLAVTDTGTGRELTRDFVLRVQQPVDPAVRGELDRHAYADGETAQFALRVANRGPGAAPLRGLIGHGAFRAWHDLTVGAGPLSESLDHSAVPGETRLAQDAATGSLVSSPLDLTDAAGALIDWDADLPDGCAIALEARTGPAPVPDESWSPWQEVLPGQPLPGSPGRFLQYRAALSSPQAGVSPALREVRIDPADPVRRVVHTTGEDFAETPAQINVSFAVDFSAADQVFFGVYTPSGRSLALDALPIRRAAAHLTAWTDRARYAAGSPIPLQVVVDAPGLLEIATPWEEQTREMGGPGSTAFTLEIPAEVASGTYLVTVDFAGERVALPVEVSGYLVRVLLAQLDRPAWFPGELAGGAIVLHTEEAVADVTIDGWVVGPGGTRAAFTQAAALGAGVGRFPFAFPTDGLAPGVSSLAIGVFRGIGGDPRALFLAGAELWFEMLAANRTPRADAGPGQTVQERCWVTLDGSASADPDGDPLAWRWTQTAGPAVLLHGGTTASPVFLAPDVPRDGAGLAFALQVSDGLAWSDADSVDVLVSNLNRPPVAIAGPDATALIGEAAVLDASGSFDPDSDLLGFHWTLVSRPEESGAELEDALGIEATLRPDRPGDYVVALTVSDGEAESPADTVVVSTRNSRPRADAGTDRSAHPGDPVELDGGASDDADGDPLTYAWSVVEQPEGGAASLDDAAAARPRLTIDRCGPHLVELTVSDGEFVSDADQVAVGCVNAAPVADAGPDRAARLGERVTLDGGASVDADGDALSFSWAFAAVPEGSAAQLDDAGVRTPSFTADREGGYALTLTVGDGIETSEPDGVSVVVGTDVARGTVSLKPAALRLDAPPRELRARIELADGFSAREIDPRAAAITAVGKKTLARPVRRIATRPATIGDADRDGRPELTLYYPVKPLLAYLRAGTRVVLTFKGPLTTWGRFIAPAPLRVSR